MIAFFIGLFAGISGFLIGKTRFVKYKFENLTLCEKIVEKDKNIIEIKDKIEEMERERMGYITENAKLRAEIEQNKQNNEEIKAQFKMQFENLANKIFDDKSKAFREQSSTNIAEILKPLQEKIKEFHTKIDEQNKEQYSLKKEIANIVLSNEKSLKITENLTKALKGEAKTQGNWGEQILEKLLENSGLMKGEHYEIQQNIKNDDGKRIIPDVIINLPEGKKVIIDSKVSLVSYEQYNTCEESNEKKIALNSFIKSIKNHIDDLHSKEYQKHVGQNTLDFVIMFMPIDGTFFLAMQDDGNIFQHGLQKNIVLSSPSTIIPILRTISQMWKVDARVKNVDEMAKRGAALYDKLSLFVDSFASIGDSLIKAQQNYKTALGRLSEGQGNVLRQAEEFKKIGGLSTAKDIARTENVEKIKNLQNMLDNNFSPLYPGGSELL